MDIPAMMDSWFGSGGAMLSFDFVCVGGGVAAGYWCEALVEGLAESNDKTLKRKTVAIITSYPEGLAPYERPALSKDCLAPDNHNMRDFLAWGSSGFPYTSAGSGRAPRSAKWYKDNSINVLAGCECIEVDLDSKTLVLHQWNERGKYTSKPKRRLVTFGRLLVATGSVPRRLGGDEASGCFCVNHPDIESGKLRDKDAPRYGYGSVHYLRDWGDCVKLVRALSSPPPNRTPDNSPPAPYHQNGHGGPNDDNNVVIVGGGFIGMEVASAVVTHYPKLTPIMVVGGSRLMEDMFSQEMSDFYHQRLSKAGVRLLYGCLAERLWPAKEEGYFTTLDGEREFGSAPAQFTECRGVVVRDQGIAPRELWVPARIVVVGIGASPNSRVFQGHLDLSPEGHIEVNSDCQSSHADVFAAGDVASFPLPLEGRHSRVSTEHVQNARDMAEVAAKNMLLAAAGETGQTQRAMYKPVPYFYSKLLDLSWKFYGVAEGEVVTLGMEDFALTQMFGAFWIRAEKVVGAFLEGGTQEHHKQLYQIAAERPKVFSVKALKGLTLQQFLDDPGQIDTDTLDVEQMSVCCRCS